MRLRSIKLNLLLVCGFLITACSESPKEPEPVDVEATEQINDKLISSMRDINNQQLDKAEDVSKNALEELSEADRQALIDLTIDESAEAITEDAEKMVDLLEDINGISDE